jgi:hypothetical protein
MKTLLILLFIAAGLNLSAQNCERNRSFQSGFTFAYFPETYVLSLYDCDIQLNGKQFYSVGISGIYPISKKLSIESGVSLSKYRIEVVQLGPDMPGTLMKDATLVSVPLIFRYSFLKYAFISTGPIFDFSLGQPPCLEDQTGIGIMVGPGFQYEFLKRISVMVNPYIAVHSLISYDMGLGNGHIIDGSVRLGVYYRF